MKISGVDIRPGNIIEYERGIWRVAKIQHTQPGKGGAYMQVEMKNLIDGRKTNVRFRWADTVERVRLDTKDFQFLYHEGDSWCSWTRTPTSRCNLPSDLIGGPAAFLQDGMEVVMEIHEERPISVQLPDTVEATIVEADAVVKGQTASSSYKPAMLDNGVRVMVPPHISSGTRIVVDVYEQTYVRRADYGSHSGLITVMTRAARKAGPRLRRDFGEIEQLQVSKKGPADFVSKADRRAEQTIIEELRKRGPIGASLRRIGRDRRQSEQAALDRRSAGWNDQLPAWRAALRHFDRGRGQDARPARPRSRTASSTSR